MAYAATPLSLEAPDVSEALRARVLDPSSWFLLDGELDI
jgi:hypothetical protein